MSDQHGADGDVVWVGWLPVAGEMATVVSPSLADLYRLSDYWTGRFVAADLKIIKMQRASSLIVLAQL